MKTPNNEKSATSSIKFDIASIFVRRRSITLVFLKSQAIVIDGEGSGADNNSAARASNWRALSGYRTDTRIKSRFLMM